MLSTNLSLDDPQYQDIRTPETQFLRCQVAPDTKVLLPVQQLTEVLTISFGQITPIPHMPPWVMGVYNWRGEVLWVADLAALIGLTPWYQQGVGAAAYSAIVLRIPINSAGVSDETDKTLALVVNQVQDIEWYSPDQIQSPPTSAITPQLVRFLRGYLVTHQGDLFTCLDGAAIVAAMPKANH